MFNILSPKTDLEYIFDISCHMYFYSVGGMEEPELTSKEMARLQRRIEETTKSLAEVRELIAVENEDLKLLDDGT